MGAEPQDLASSSPTSRNVGSSGDLSTPGQPETRAARHRGQPAPRLTPSSLYWHFTKAPRRRLTDPNHDVIRPALTLFALTVFAFGVAARDLTTQFPWYIPVRGLGALLGGLLLVWGMVAYLGRPPTLSKPSLVAKARQRHRDRNDGAAEDDR